MASSIGEGLGSRSQSLTTSNRGAGETPTTRPPLRFEVSPSESASSQHARGSRWSLGSLRSAIGTGSGPPLSRRVWACLCLDPDLLPSHRLGLAAAVLLTAAVLVIMKTSWSPDFYYNGELQPERHVYILLFSMALSIYNIAMGAPTFKVLPLMVATLAFFGVVSTDDVLSGFAKQGAWLPQCLLVIITAVRESGVLEEVLPWMSGMHVRRLGCVRTHLQLQVACAVMGLLVGVAPAVATVMPLVMQWARNEHFHCGPPLMLMVVSTTCGSLMLISSVPVNIFIRGYIATSLPHVDLRTDLSIIAPLPPMLIIFAVVSLYAAVASCKLVPRGHPAHQGAAAALVDEAICKWRRSAQSIKDSSGDSGCQANLFNIHQSSDGPEVQPEVQQLVYTVEFVVNQGSSICGLLPSSAGLMASDQIQLVRISRKSHGVQLRQSLRADSYRESRTRSRFSTRFSTEFEFAATNSAGSGQADDDVSISQWVIHAGDVLVARCSAAGIIAMRTKPGVFPLHSLPWIGHALLKHRRHQRRLFECAVAGSSTLIGQTLQEILSDPDGTSGGSDAEADRIGASQQPQAFLEEFKGIPLGGWRQSSASPVKSLDFRTDAVQAGDVLLIDAHQTFPDLRITRKNFTVVSLVANSQAPRHGRNLDRTRGMMGISFLLAANVMVHSLGVSLFEAFSMGTLFFVATRAVHFQQALESLSWPMLLTFWAGGTISEAILKTGLAHMLANWIIRLGQVTGSQTAVVLALALLAQLLANLISNAPAGFIMAPLAVEVARWTNLTAHDICIILVITCNMTLLTPFGRGVNSAICGPAGLTSVTFLKFGLPIQVVATVVVVCWVMLDNDSLKA